MLVSGFVLSKVISFEPEVILSELNLCHSASSIQVLLLVWDSTWGCLTVPQHSGSSSSLNSEDNHHAKQSPCWEVQGYPELPIQSCPSRDTPYGAISPFSRRPNCPAVIRTCLHSYSPSQFCCHELRGMYHSSCTCVRVCTLFNPIRPI